MTFYVITRNGIVQKLDKNNLLTHTGKREAGELFDDYGQARNAVRRTTAAWKVQKMLVPFKIVRVEL